MNENESPRRGHGSDCHAASVEAVPEQVFDVETAIHPARPVGAMTGPQVPHTAAHAPLPTALSDRERRGGPAMADMLDHPIRPPARGGLEAMRMERFRLDGARRANIRNERLALLVIDMISALDKEVAA
ncbi:MAG: hypothetical protein AAF982_00910 [Pseudomonadota bacterium]